MDDLIKEFVDETMDSLGEIDLDLVKLEQDPTNQELLGNVFRLMHTIKGTCGFIGLPRLEKTAHAGENLLENFRSGEMEISETAMTVLFMCIDRVRFLLSQVANLGHEPDGKDDDIIDAIEAELNSVSEAEVDNGPNSADEQIISEEEAGIVCFVPEDYVQESGIECVNAQVPVTEKGPEYLKVQMSVLEELVNMLSELVLTRNQLLQLIKMEESSPLNMPLQRLNRIVSDLQESVMKTRMQPIGNAWSKLPRIVRDLSTDLKKKISLEMKGEETELDRQVLELIKDPLTHMIRNSCDHGIETPEERLAKDKPESGIINLNAYHEGGFIIIQIKDDGKGLDAKKIATKAIEKGIHSAEEISNMSEKQILSCIMKPGFSTAEQVTSVSGRGVGMDVVRSNIEKIGGSIDMDSTPGKGTSFRIQIPLTLAIISALIVEINERLYAIPQMNIQELVSLDSDQNDKIEFINNKPVLRLRERIIPLLNKEVLFDLENGGDLIDFSDKLIVIMSTGASFYGIIVDKIFDTEEVVIKSVSSVLKNLSIFSGNTILGDGQVIMILDPVAIARKFNVEHEVSQFEILNAENIRTKVLQEEKAPLLLFRAGDGAIKSVPLAIISRLQVFDGADITKSAEKMMVQFNGSLIQLCFVDPQTQKIPDDDFTSIVLSDDRSESSLGLIIEEVIDIVDGSLELSESTSRPGILGSMILAGKTVDVIDITYFLNQNRANWFSKNTHAMSPYTATHIETMRTKHNEGQIVMPNPNPPAQVHAHILKSANDPPHILLVDDSNFFRSMLHPILNSAGYRVTLSEDALKAIELHDDGHMFDIILSDIEMPGMDGYEFVEKMREKSAWKDLPFIAITSHNTPADVEYGFKKGFNQYIGKFDKDELIRSLQNVEGWSSSNIN